MYFWNVNALVDDLKHDRVTQKEQFKYYLLFSIVTVIFMDPYFYDGSTYNIYDLLNSILSVLITAFGTYYCFKINSSGDNKDFIVRMILLGLPIAIRAVVIFIPLMFVAMTIEAFFIISPDMDVEKLDNFGDKATLSSVIYLALFLIGYFWYLAKKIKEVSTSSPQKVWGELIKIRSYNLNS